MTTITCPQCHHVNPDDTEFCEQCGAQLPVAVAVGASSANAMTPAAAPQGQASAGSALICPTCQAPLAPGDEFCFNCGTDVRNLTSQTPATPTGPQPAAPVTTPDPNAMTDDALNKALSQIDNGPSGQNPATHVNQVGPEAQPAVVPPQAPPNPPVGATSGGSLPAQPGVAGGVAANAFGMPPAPATPTPPPPAASSNGNPTAAPVGASSGQLHLQITGPYGEEAVDWSDHEILLGRNDPKTRVFPDVNLDDSAASRRHLSIWKEPVDGMYYAQDLESANGTSLNGQDLRPGEATLLHDGDVLKIGTRYNIQVKIS